MRKIGADIFAEAINELSEETSSMKKRASINADEQKNQINYNVPIAQGRTMPNAVHQPSELDEEVKRSQNGKFMLPVATILGSLAGFGIGKKIAEKKFQDKLNNEYHQNLPALSGDYYHQTKQLIGNLHVLFMPFGVILMVKDGAKETVIDTIETSEMTPNMRKAWQSKDEVFYRDLVANKMHSELQIAEQEFAKQFLEKQQSFNSKISKNASEDDFNDDFDLMGNIEAFNKMAFQLDNISRMNEGLRDKYVGTIVSTMDKVAFDIDLSLPRPFEKFAFLHNVQNSLGFGTDKSKVKAMQGNLNDIGYLKRNVKIGFLPDRVVYTVNNMAISTLPVIKMNSDTFEHFENEDKNHFMQLLLDDAKMGLKDMKGKLNKEASEKHDDIVSVSEIFEKPTIHPYVYYKVLTDKYGEDWFNFDAHALIKIIETDFNVDSIDDLALTKILSVQVVNKNEDVYNNYHILEKIIRAFNDKNVDFELRQIDDIDIGDLAFGIDVMNMVTPHDDIYDNFAPDVYDYFCTVMINHESFIYDPCTIIGSPNEPIFSEILSYSALQAFNKKIIASMLDDEALQEATLKDNNDVFNISRTILTAIRNKFIHVISDSEKTSLIVDELLKKLETRSEIINQARIQVLKNISIDKYVDNKKALLAAQLKAYKIN